MRISGSIRRMGVNPRQLLFSRRSRPPIALPDGTGHRGPDAHHSGPGHCFLGGLPRSFCTFLEVPSTTVDEYFAFLPMERTYRLRAKEQL